MIGVFRQDLEGEFKGSPRDRGLRTLERHSAKPGHLHYLRDTDIQRFKRIIRSHTARRELRQI